MPRTYLLVTVVIAAAAPACRPDLGAPPSLVIGPRILAIRGAPAEAPPGTDISYDALVVDVGGRVTDPTLGWTLCLDPHPPAESNIVNSTCLDTTATPDASTGPTFTAPTPSGSDDACMLFGPITPSPKPGQPATRPADADVTGGYYQPVRMIWYETNGGTEMAFSLERILCRLANAASDVAGDYAMNYVPNDNPTLASLTLDPDGAATPLYTTGQATPPPPASVAAGQTVALEVTWPADTGETFLVYDVASHSLVMQTESLRVAWFATGGAFQFDATGRTNAMGDAEPSTRNLWTAPSTPGPVYFWAVLRDDRGGLDFVPQAEIDVTP